MGLFEAVFGRFGWNRAQMSQYWKTLQGYTPVFTNWSG